MALTKNQQTVQDLFGTHLGRQAGTAGQDYWAAELDRGQTVEDLVRELPTNEEILICSICKWRYISL